MEQCESVRFLILIASSCVSSFVALEVLSLRLSLVSLRAV